MLLLPPLTHVVGVTNAVPMLTMAQLVGNFSRAGFGWREIRWRPVALFLVTAIPFALIGALSFVSLPKGLVVRLVGLAILAFVVLRLAGIMKMEPNRTMLLIGGAIVGALSGLVGSAGPLGAAIFLSLNLPAVAYVSSEAVTAIGMHAVKMVVYGVGLKLVPLFWLLAAGLGAAMVAGTWVSRKLVQRIPTKWFQRFVTVLLVIIAIQMIITG